MDEGAAERERQPIISNLFPVSEQSVLTAFSNLDLRENPTGADVAAEQEMDILINTNPHVDTSYVQILSEFPPAFRDMADRIFWGILIAHQTLREEARLKGGILPAFTRDFVQDYHNKEAENIRAESRDKNLSIQEIATQLRNRKLVEFEHREVEFSRIVRDKLGGGRPDWHPQDDPRYLGIVDLYTLFRAGLSDPKNFQQ